MVSNSGKDGCQGMHELASVYLAGLFFSFKTENQCHYNCSSGVQDEAAKMDSQVINRQMKAMERTSHVFRDGDYNGASQFYYIFSFVYCLLIL